MPEYEPLPPDRVGEKIDEDRCYEHVNRRAEDGSWFETTNGDVLGVAKADQFTVQSWNLWDLLIVERRFAERKVTFHVTHVDSDESLLLDWHNEDIDAEGNQELN